MIPVTPTSIVAELESTLREALAEGPESAEHVFDCVQSMGSGALGMLLTFCKAGLVSDTDALTYTNAVTLWVEHYDPSRTGGSRN